jgi:NTE family protein
LPWIDRLFVVARPADLAHWRMDAAQSSGQPGQRVRIEAVPVIESPDEQAAAAAQARRAGFDLPRIYLPAPDGLDDDTRDGFQSRHLCQTALPAQRGILRLARAAVGARVGIALGAGGARGFAHIGVVRYLEELGVVADAIAGTSMGALVGAGLAQGLDSYGAEELMQEFIKSRIRRLLRPTLSRHSIFSRRGLIDICRWIYGKTTFAELATPMAIVATDLVTGRGIALRNGSVARAVHASVTIPGIFPPVVAGPYVFVDGGVCEPVPTSALADLGADIKLSVNISVTPDDMERWARDEGAGEIRRAIRSGSLPNILDTYMATINIAVADRSNSSSRLADITIRPRFRTTSWREFTDGPEHLRRGYQAAESLHDELAAVIPWLCVGE